MSNACTYLRTCWPLSGGMRRDRLYELTYANNKLASLALDEAVALQLRQMFGASRTRRADEFRDILMAERLAQKRAARFLNTKVRTYLQERDRYPVGQSRA